MAALSVVRGTERDLGLGADGRDRRAQFMRGVGGEAALGAEQRLDAGEQMVQRLDQRQQFAVGIVQRQRLQCLRLASGQRSTQSMQRRDGTRHRPPHHQRQQRQRPKQRPQRVVQGSPEDGVARAAALADLDDDIAPGAARHEHAPCRAVDTHVVETPPFADVSGHQLLPWRVRRTQREAPVAEHLESHGRCIAMQRARLDRAVVVIPMALRQQGGRRLREVAVEQFLEFVPGVEPGQRCGREP